MVIPLPDVRVLEGEMRFRLGYSRGRKKFRVFSIIELQVGGEVVKLLIEGTFGSLFFKVPKSELPL